VTGTKRRAGLRAVHTTVVELASVEIGRAFVADAVAVFV
jgi:hypothetical protein